MPKLHKVHCVHFLWNMHAMPLRNRATTINFSWGTGNAHFRSGGPFTFTLVESYFFVLDRRLLAILQPVQEELPPERVNYLLMETERLLHVCTVLSASHNVFVSHLPQMQLLVQNVTHLLTPPPSPSHYTSSPHLLPPTIHLPFPLYTFFPLLLPYTSC